MRNDDVTPTPSDPRSPGVPHGAAAGRTASTSIDDLLGGATEPIVSGTSPVDDILANEAEAEPLTAAEAAAEKQKLDKNRFGVPMIFVVGLTLMMVFGTMLYDELGPKVERTAQITSKHRERDRKGRIDEYVSGRDSHGGEFEISVSSEVFGRASVGDKVVISRSRLTGRVVQVTGPDWSDGGSSWKMWVSIVLLGLGVFLSVIAAVISKRTVLPKLNPHERRHHLRWVGAFALASVIGVGVWIAIERAEANLGGSPQPATTTATATANAPSLITCGTARTNAERWVSAFNIDGTISQSDIDSMVAVVSAEQPACSYNAVLTAVCDAIKRPSPSALPTRSWTLNPATTCALR